MKRLKVRKLKKKKYPHGIFKWIIETKSSDKQQSLECADKESREIESFCKKFRGKYRFSKERFILYFRGKDRRFAIINKIYIEEESDVLLFKLSKENNIHKIKKIIVG